MAKKSKAPAAKKKAPPKPRKPAARATPAAARRKPTAPVPVKTGKGPGPLEIGKSLVEMFNRGLFAEIEDTWWDKKKIASVEGHGVGMAWVGLKAVRAKNDGWVAEHAIHGASAEGPFVGSTGFTVRFKMDVETKATGQRQVMDEVGVYTVENGKIVREEFMYLIP